MMVISHPLNWQAGWWLVLIGFLAGAGMGLSFHREAFLGGYASFPRRLLRLGHIALVALGMLNVLFAVAVPSGGTARWTASYLLILGAVSMPATCFLTAWSKAFRFLFPIPVLSLILAVILILIGGPS